MYYILILLLIYNTERSKVQGKVALGETNFLKFIQGDNIYVDKSMFIKDLFIHPDHKFIIVRPRRWGKSLNLDMIRRFYEIEVHPKTGYELPEEKKINKKLFDINSERRLLISQDTEFVKSYQGRYPIIYMNFGKAVGDTFKEIRNAICEEIKNEYERHSYLFDRLNYTGNRENFKKTFMSALGNYSWSYVNFSIQMLGKALTRIYQREIMVLIDNFDSPFLKSFELQPKYAKKNYKIVEDHLYSLYEILSNIPDAKKSILTGINPAIYRLNLTTLRPFMDSLFAGRYAVLKFCRHYGIIEEELDSLLMNTGLEDKKQEILKWYGGYFCNKENTEDDKLLYKCKNREVLNPWSVMSFIRRCGKFSNYWIKSGVPTISDKINASLPVIDFVASLYPNKSALYPDYIDLRVNFQIQPFNLCGTESGILSELNANGFLTVELRKDAGYALGIPNLEISDYIDKILTKLLKKRIAEFHTRKPIAGFGLTPEFNVTKFVTNLKKAMEMMVLPKYWYYNENYYNMFICGLLRGDLKTIRTTCETIIENQNGIIYMKPKIPNLQNVCILLQHRGVNETFTPKEEAHAALANLRDNHFKKMQKECGPVKEIIMISLAFSNTEVCSFYDVDICSEVQ